MAKSNRKDWMLVGIVAGAFGIKGEVKVRLETDFPQRFNAGNKIHLWLPADGSIKERTIETCRHHKECVLVKLDGCDDRTTAEKMVGGEMLAPMHERAPLEENQYYISDLMGMNVFTTDGRNIGKIDNVLSYPANDVYVVGKILIPAIRSVVREVDVQERTMIIEPMEGLLPEDDEN